jgi:UDP-2,4-diacetamido-2,4,6-trideoxy-beta-L-altropyranose hydrolase
VRIALRCDAAPEMGIGHLMRCLTLADALRARGATCRLLLGPTSAHRQAMVADRGHDVAILALDGDAAHVPSPADPPMAPWLPWGQAQDGAATVAALEPGTRWIVADHYGIDARWHEAMRAQGLRVMAIDDMADRSLAPDLLLDHNASASAALYAPRLRRPARELFGPGYALIRPEIEALRKSPEAAARTIRRILVTFGGASPPAHYAHTAEALARLDCPDLQITLVGVADATAALAIGELSRDGLDFATLPHAPDLAERTAAADLCIGAAGVSALERALIGTPSLTYVTADNQRLAIAALASAGAIVDMGDIARFDAAALVDTIRRLTYMPADREQMVRKGQTLVPGGGPAKVANIILDT